MIARIASHDIGVIAKRCVKIIAIEGSLVVVPESLVEVLTPRKFWHVDLQHQQRDDYRDDPIGQGDHPGRIVLAIAPQ